MIYAERPKDFRKTCDVVACYVEHHGKFLMLKRHADKPNGDRWGLPAGKVDPGENLGEAMCRELHEETGIVCESGSLVLWGSVLVNHDNVGFEYHMYKLELPEVPEVTVNNIEHVEASWFLPVESLSLHQVDDQVECTKLVYGV